MQKSCREDPRSIDERTTDSSAVTLMENIKMLRTSLQRRKIREIPFQVTTRTSPWMLSPEIGMFVSKLNVDYDFNDETL